MQSGSINRNGRRLALWARIAVVGISMAWAQTSPPTGGGGTGGGTTTTSVTYYATYKLDGGAASTSGQTYNATAADTSAVWVTNSGALTLTNPTIATSGNTSSTDNSSFYGLNAALLATAAGSVTVNGGTITTTGLSGNGAFSTGTGSSVALTGVTINASADGGHAVMATAGAAMTLTNCTLNTTGGSSSAVATDRGGGTVNVTGGAVTAAGGNSAGLYSTGALTATNTTFKVTGAEMAVIEGANSINLNNASLTSTFTKWGVMIYQSMSGDASGTQGVFTMTGGSLNYTPTSGPLFYVNNTTGTITLKGVAATTNSGVFLNAAAGSWGATGSNGGTVVLTGDGQTMTGDMAIDKISSLALTLKNASALKGAINNANTASAANVTLDSTSQWSLTADSYVSAFSDASGISGTSVSNVTGNGHNVYYNSSLSANSSLGAKTYTLANGGHLLPVGTTVTPSLPTIDTGGVVNAASNIGGVAPAAWISIYGTNLATATDTAASSDVVNGYLPTTFGGSTVTVDGKSAYFSYASPTQLNVQAPADTNTGSVTVKVTTSAGSGSIAANLSTVLPGLFTASNYVLAVRYSDSAIVNGTGAAASGYTTAAAAHPGDILEIYATGLGATTTTVAPGLVFSGAYATTVTPTVTIGGTNAAVSYCGLIGAGLYQINLTVPTSLTAGTYPVVVSLNGVSSPTTAVMKIAAN